MSRKQKSDTSKNISKKDNISSIRQFLQISFTLQKHVFKALGLGWFVFLYFQQIAQAILPIITAYLIAKLIDLTIKSVQTGILDSRIWYIILVWLVIRFFNVILQSYFSLGRWIRDLIKVKLYKYYVMYTLGRQEKLRLEFLEDPKIASTMKLLEKRISVEGFRRIFDKYLQLLMNIFTLISIVAILALKEPIIFILVVMFTIPMGINTWFINKAFTRFWDSSINFIRRINRAVNYIQVYNRFLEIQEFGITHYLLKYLGKEWFFDNEAFMGFSKQMTFSGRMLLDLTAIIDRPIIALVLVWQAVRRVITIGQITYYLNLAGQVKGAADYSFWAYSSLQQDFYYLNKFFDFWDNTIPSLMKRSNKGHKLVSTIRNHDIHVKDLYFKYNKTKVYALNGISLHIPYGANIAIVGPNGAGKTTFLKVLLSHYVSYKGSVKIGNFEVRDYDYQYFLSRFSILPQKFIKLNFATVYDVIQLDKEARKYVSSPFTIEDLSAANIFKSQKEFSNVIWNAGLGKYKDLWQEVVANKQKHNIPKHMYQILKDVKLYKKVKSLPHGIFTYLSPDFSDGVDLSLGQWQRLHIARILYAPGDILILDEPTSAIDPLTSFKLIDMIFERFKDRTVIVVSHRYSTIAKADYIYVFDQGKIVDQGTHKELIKKNGYYAKAYKEEMKRLKG